MTFLKKFLNFKKKKIEIICECGGTGKRDYYAFPMGTGAFCLITGGIIIVSLTRIINGFSWLSLVGFIIFGFLGMVALKESKEQGESK